MEKKTTVQFQVRTDLRAGASYPDRSGVCSGAGLPDGSPYPDLSGICSGQQLPSTPTTNYPDRSGVCA